MDNGFNNQHQEHISHVEIIIKRDIWEDVIPLQPLSTNLQQWYGIDTKTHACVGKDAECKFTASVNNDKTQHVNYVGMRMHINVSHRGALGVVLVEVTMQMTFLNRKLNVTNDIPKLWHHVRIGQLD